MTTANPQHAQPGRVSQAWRNFRRWRGARPFWGGLFTALAGLEIFSTTQMSLSGLTFQMGPTGFLSWLIPVILVACGMLMWFTPQQRMFYAIVGAVTAVFSLIGVNLGGIFVGMLLGMIGSALGFAWVPARRPATTPAGLAPAEPDEEPSDADAERVDEPALIDELMRRAEHRDEVTGPLTDTLPPPRNPLRESLPTDGGDHSTQLLPVVGPDGRPQQWPGEGGPGQRQGAPHRDPKLLAVTLVLLSVSAAGALALRTQAPVQAAPAACPTPSATRTAEPDPSASRPADESPSPSPGPERTSGGDVLTDILDGIGDLFTGGDDAPAAEPTVSPEPREGAPTTGAPTAGPTATGGPTSSPKPTPDASATPGKPGDGCATPKPTEPAEVEPGKPLPRIAAEPGQPRVAAKPSKLTGSKVTMTGLRFEGIVDLPTGDGTLKVLKFSMAKGVTDDFLLQADGPGGKTMRYATDRLTVQGDVAFYATRFVGRLLGIKIILTPDLPFPDGIPITLPIPITFTDPVIDLAYVDSDVLTAKPALKVDLA
ncbi:DUF6114 domain-containing protein [Micromonospora sp. ATCC 39149]|uniref:Anion permease n=1 Tax=Micromonospora carbonacea TaxID=47853 RepID=A0A7D5YEN7_9ACTN|nr:DUF6114 domain-containing protein [Micromonospora sp. ATCC 39149]QLJ98375.1 anion permease [Micromonospora carbonacea]